MLEPSVIVTGNAVWDIRPLFITPPQPITLSGSSLPYVRSPVSVDDLEYPADCLLVS